MKLRPNLSLYPMGDAYMVVDNGDGRTNRSTVYTLNATAAFLWRIAQEGPFTPEGLAAQLMQTYGITEERARVDVRNIISTWQQGGLLEPEV